MLHKTQITAVIGVVIVVEFNTLAFVYGVHITPQMWNRVTNMGIFSKQGLQSWYNSVDAYLTLTYTLVNNILNMIEYQIQVQ